MADYDPPPRDYGLSERYHHYGWPVTDEMLQTILVKLKIPLPPVPDFYAATLGGYLMRRLRFRDGISYVWCRPDEWCDKKDRVLFYEEEGEKIHFVAFLTIGCTYSKKYFWRRPTQEGLETLIRVFEERARWMEDFKTRENFVLDAIEWDG